MCFVFPFLSIVVMKEFDSKFRILRDYLNHKSRIFERDYEKLIMVEYHDRNQVNEEKRRIEESFLNDIYSCAKHHHHLLG